MKKLNLRHITLAAASILGISVLAVLFVFIFKKLGIDSMSRILKMPEFIIIPAGISLALFFFPLFAAAQYRLARKFPAGQSNGLVTGGIYKYVRNPMYSGAGFTIAGAGLMADSTGIFLSGIIWLCAAYFIVRAEEEQLLYRYGCDYYEYRKSTPAFIPKFSWMIRDLKERGGKE